MSSSASSAADAIPSWTAFHTCCRMIFDNYRTSINTLIAASESAKRETKFLDKSPAALSASIATVRPHVNLLFLMTISVGFSCVKPGFPYPWMTSAASPTFSVTRTPRPARIARFKAPLRSFAPLSAPTATMQSPLGPTPSSLVIISVVGCLAVIRGCPRAPKTSTIFMFPYRLKPKEGYRYRSRCTRRRERVLSAV